MGTNRTIFRLGVGATAVASWAVSRRVLRACLAMLAEQSPPEESEKKGADKKGPGKSGKKKKGKR